MFHPHASTPSAFGPSQARCAPSFFDGAPLQQSHSCLPAGATQHQRAQGSPWGAQGRVPNTLQPGRAATSPRTRDRGAPSPVPSWFLRPSPTDPAPAPGLVPITTSPQTPGGTAPGVPAAFPAAPQLLGTIPGARLQQETRAHSSGEAAVALILPASQEPEQGGLIKTIPWGCGAAEMQGGWREGGRPAWEMAAPPGTSPCPLGASAPSSGFGARLGSDFAVSQLSSGAFESWQLPMGRGDRVTPLFWAWGQGDSPLCGARGQGDSPLPGAQRSVPSPLRPCRLPPAWRCIWGSHHPVHLSVHPSTHRCLYGRWRCPREAGGGHTARPPPPPNPATAKTTARGPQPPSPHGVLGVPPPSSCWWGSDLGVGWAPWSSLGAVCPPPHQAAAPAPRSPASPASPGTSGA